MNNLMPAESGSLPITITSFEDANKWHTINQAAISNLARAWVIVGKCLHFSREQNIHQFYGFSQFSRYCAEKLKISYSKAREIMQAYRYVENNWPELLGNTEPQINTDYTTLNKLRRIKENAGVDKQEMIEPLEVKLIQGELKRSQLIKNLKVLGLLPSGEASVSEDAEIHKAMELLKRKLDEMPDGDDKKRAGSMLSEIQNVLNKTTERNSLR